MFGPKNAPSAQTQYAFLQGVDNIQGGSQAIVTHNNSGASSGQVVILTVTQLHDVPISDVFKVVQYYSFASSTHKPDHCTVKIGLLIHYVKPSLFKSQILSGIKQELDVQVKQWSRFSSQKIKSALSLSDGIKSDTDKEQKDLSLPLAVEDLPLHVVPSNDKSFGLEIHTILIVAIAIFFILRYEYRLSSVNSKLTALTRRINACESFAASSVVNVTTTVATLAKDLAMLKNAQL